MLAAFVLLHFIMATSNSNTAVTLDNIAALFTENNKKIENMLTVQFKAWSENFNERFVVLDEKVTRLEGSNIDVLTRLDELERRANLNDLLVYGIPTVAKEDVHSIFLKICKAIDFDVGEGQLLTAFRVHKNDGPIILKFANSVISNNLFRKYLDKKDLNLKHIGFDSDKRIFIRESLSKKNAMIFSEALKLRRNGVLASSYSRKGLVFIRISQDDNPLLVSSLDYLFEISSALPQHNSNKRRLNISSGSSSSPISNNAKSIKTFLSTDARADKLPLSGDLTLNVS